MLDAGRITLARSTKSRRERGWMAAGNSNAGGNHEQKSDKIARRHRAFHEAWLQTAIENDISVVRRAAHGVHAGRMRTPAGAREHSLNSLVRAGGRLSGPDPDDMQRKTNRAQTLEAPAAADQSPVTIFQRPDPVPIADQICRLPVFFVCDMKPRLMLALLWVS